MKKKIIFMLTIVTLFLAPVIVANADTQNGWVQEDGQTYYYENGEKVKGFKDIGGKTYFFSNVNSALKTGVQKLNNDISQMFYLNADGTVYHGWKKIDGATYYFGEDNYAVRGFKDIGGKTYFFSMVNNALKTGVQKLNNDISQMFYLNADGTVYHGWKKIDGATYYFGDDHYAVRGFKDIGGKTYFFSMVNNILKSGVQKLNNDITQMFFLNDDGTVYHGWKKIDGATYYFCDDHYAARGFKEIDGQTYFFSMVNNILKTGWQKLDNDSSKTFYLTEDGVVCDGWTTIDKDTYYFGEDHFAKGGMRQINGKSYHLDEESYKLLTGLHESNNKLIYSNDVGEIQYGFQTINGNKYYFADDGYAISGFKEINTKVYYFDTETFKMLIGLQTVNNKLIYTNDLGEVQDGWQTIGKDTYYFGEDHFAKSGIQTINEKKYYFNEENYKLVVGLQKIGDKLIYTNAAGEVQYGWQTVEGNKYYFGEDGFAVKGFQPIDGKTYFFSNINYALKKGYQEIDGRPFYLNDDGSIYQGWQTVNGNKYYFGEDGFALNGFQPIDGKTYFFSNINYALKTGWQMLNENKSNIFYLSDEGTVTYGKITLEGRDYIFGDDGFLDGFVYKNGKWYYYNPDGSLAKGIQRMAGRYFQFNEITGAFEKYVNQRIVIDVSHHQGDIDWQKVKNSGLVDAVILRAGYGVSWMDDKFMRNVAELNRLGIPYSVYLFSYAESAKEASMEADNLINIIKNSQANIASDIFSIYYDLEDWTIGSTGENSNGISKETYEAMYNSFASKVENALGTEVKIYASKAFIEDRFPTSLREHVGWVAQWGPQNTYTGTYEGWQYTNCGSIPGISGCVDMSIFYY